MELIVGIINVIAGGNIVVSFMVVPAAVVLDLVTEVAILFQYSILAIVDVDVVVFAGIVVFFSFIVVAAVGDVVIVVVAQVVVGVAKILMQLSPIQAQISPFCSHFTSKDILPIDYV